MSGRRRKFSEAKTCETDGCDCEEWYDLLHAIKKNQVGKMKELFKRLIAQVHHLTTAVDNLETELSNAKEDLGVLEVTVKEAEEEQQFHEQQTAYQLRFKRR